MDMFKRLLKNECGQVLPMSLILLALGGLLVVPVLALTSTNLNANRIVQQNTLELYAADAGVAEILWNMRYNDDFSLPADGGQWPTPRLTFTLNGRSVEAWLNKEAGQPYKITSTATSPDGHTTTIECLVNAQPDFSWLFEHAIISPGNVTLQPNNTVYGGVYCGGEFSGNPEDVKTGGIQEGKTVNLPTADMLSAYYGTQVDKNNPYPSDTYTVSGGTVANPVNIPPLYREGNLSISGSGYARLTGTIYVDGQFEFGDKDVILDLNGQTIYATYNNCSQGDAIKFGPDTQIIGPGCIIAIGNINFQPKLGQGKHLLGAGGEADDNVPDPWQTEPANRVVLQKFKADSSGTLSSLQVRCLAPNENAEELPKIKVALYDNSKSDKPGIVLTWDEGEVNLIENAWHTLDLKLPALENLRGTPVQDRKDREISLGKNTYYWLAAVADTSIISRETALTDNSMYQNIIDFSTFEFEDNPAGPFTSPGYDYHLRGFSGGQEFIMLMSVKCTVNLQPKGNLYGCIVGNTEVNLQPNCFINLVGVPEDGLNFPGFGAGDNGGDSSQINIITYTIK